MPSWVKSIPWPPPSRPPRAPQGHRGAIRHRLRRLCEAGRRRIEAGGGKPAAFICERMPGCGGQVLLRKKNLNWSAMFAGWGYTWGGTGYGSR